MSVETVMEWLSYDDADLDAAWSCARGERAAPGQAAYHVQQSAEKLLKAVLVASGVQPPRTHDLEKICRLLPEAFPDRQHYEELSRFTVFAFAFRYPDEDVPEPLPSQEQVDAWSDEIAALKRAFETWLAARTGKGKAR